MNRRPPLVVAALVFALGCQGTVVIPAPRREAGPPSKDAGVGDSKRDDAPFDALASDADLDADDPDTTFDFDTAPEDTGYDPGTEYTDAANVCNELEGGADAEGAPPGSRYCEIYRDIISHGMGSAKCQTLGCHGGDKGQHHLSMGWDVRSSYDAITVYVATFWKPSQRLVVPVEGGDSRPLSALMRYIKAPPGYEALMPALRPWVANRKLNADELQHIDDWLARGAPYD